jgi:hypothetical protein
VLQHKCAGVCEALPELLGTAAHRDESVAERADITAVGSGLVLGREHFGALGFIGSLAGLAVGDAADTFAVLIGQHRV